MIRENIGRVVCDSGRTTARVHAALDGLLAEISEREYERDEALDTARVRAEGLRAWQAKAADSEAALAAAEARAEHYRQALERLGSPERLAPDDPDDPLAWWYRTEAHERCAFARAALAGPPSSPPTGGRTVSLAVCSTCGFFDRADPWNGKPHYSNGGMCSGQVRRVEYREVAPSSPPEQTPQGSALTGAPDGGAGAP